MAAQPPPAARLVRAPGPSDHVTPYDRLAWTDEDVESLLVSGAQRPELMAFFGAQEYRALARLAHAARTAPVAPGARRTIIVPGIMGSQLGFPRQPPLPRDILWLDPLDIIQGRLTELALPGRVNPTLYGVLLYSYLRLKLHLRIAGLDPVFHQYDWRRGIAESGDELARRITAEPADRIALVGHSLGGLVSRAALALPGGEKVERLVLLGTPSLGSFAAVQALRGTADVVLKIARLDLRHTAGMLASQVFQSFASLYDLLPRAGAGRTPDLFEEATWPGSESRPDPQLLRAAREIERKLAPADERCLAVVGGGFPTVTSLTRRREEFVYTITRHGDGTVPIPSAELPSGRNYYASVLHSELPRDRRVAEAVAELVRTGVTRRLPAVRHSTSRAEARIGDRALSLRVPGKIDWARLTPEQRRRYLQSLSEPLAIALRIPARAG